MNTIVTDFIQNPALPATEAFAFAIRACAESGGGYVDVPAGEYISGTIELESNVFLRVHAGAMIYGSDSITDYRGSKRGCSWSVGVTNLVCSPGMAACEALILADRKHDCGVVGEGVIDGRRSTVHGYTSEKGRPFLLVLSECERVTVSGVTMKNPGMFTNYFLNCTDVRVTGLRIYSADSANGDGIDFDGSKNVIISDCNIDAGDDGIGLKTLTAGEPCENFTITNCIIRSKYWGAIRIGPESVADIRNIVMSNCVFRECNDGLKLQLCEDSVFEDFTFTGITMINVTRPFFVTSNSYPMSTDSHGLYPRPGVFRRLTISSVTAVQSQLYDYPTTFDGCFFCGLPDGKIEDISLNNIRISVPGGGDAVQAARTDHAELIDNSEFYPEIMPKMGDYPCASLYFKNVARVSLCDVRITARDPDLRAAFAAEEVGRLDMSHCSTDGCAALLRYYRTDVFPSDCEGKIYTLTADTAVAWDAFRSMSVKYMNELRAGALLTTAALTSHREHIYTANALEMTAKKPDNGQKTYIIFTRVHGSFTVTVNGVSLTNRCPPEVYDNFTPFTADLTSLLSEDNNTVRVVPAAGYASTDAIIISRL